MERQEYKFKVTKLPDENKNKIKYLFRTLNLGNILRIEPLKQMKDGEINFNIYELWIIKKPLFEEINFILSAMKLEIIKIIHSFPFNFKITPIEEDIFLFEIKSYYNKEKSEIEVFMIFNVIYENNEFKLKECVELNSKGKLTTCLKL